MRRARSIPEQLTDAQLIAWAAEGVEGLVVPLPQAVSPIWLQQQALRYGFCVVAIQAELPCPAAHSAEFEYALAAVAEWSVALQPEAIWLRPKRSERVLTAERWRRCVQAADTVLRYLNRPIWCAAQDMPEPITEDRYAEWLALLPEHVASVVPSTWQALPRVVAVQGSTAPAAETHRAAGLWWVER